jgi:hypothetical protein
MDHYQEVLLVLHPRWQRDALCRDYPNLSWYPTTGQPYQQQVSICFRCAVQAECADAGDTNREPFGIWGGVSANSRIRGPHRPGVAA